MAAAGAPSCRRTTDATAVVTAHQRLVAGGKAKPPLVDKVNGFAWPDTSLNPVKTRHSLFFFASDGGCHAKCRGARGRYGSVTRTAGTLDNPLGKTAPVDVQIAPNPDPAVNPHYASYTYMGGGPVYVVPKGSPDSGHLLLLYHAEINTASSFYSLLGLAASADDGRHWTDLGEILRPNVAYGRDLPGFDVGDPRLVEAPDGKYFYLYFSDWLVGASTQGGQGTYTVTSVARAPIRDVLRAAFSAQPHAALFAKFYDGRWDQPAIGGVSTDLMPNAAYGGAHAVYTDPPLSRYVMLLDDTQNISYALSPDGLRWSAPALLGTYGSDTVSANYAAAAGPGRDPNRLENDFYVYFTRSKDWPSATVQRFSVECK